MTSARIGLSAVSGAPHRDLRTPEYRRFDSCLLIVGAVESHLLPTGQSTHSAIQVDWCSRPVGEKPANRTTLEKSHLRKHGLAPEQPFPGTNRLMTMINTPLSRSSLPSLAVASVLTFIPASSPAQTAGQDVHNAGSATKDAAKDTGHAVKKTSQNAAAKTKSGTEKGYDKTKEGGTVAVDKTKETSVKSYDKSKEGVQKVVDPSAERKSKVTDKSRETNMKAKDNAKRTEQKAKDATPQ